MSNVININFQDTIISQWEEAVDKKSAEKTLAFKYFNGNKEDLNNYLFPRDSIAAGKKNLLLWQLSTTRIIVILLLTISICCI
mgnify:CR=1 FL=1